MKKIRNLCILTSALTALTFSAPALGQNMYNLPNQSKESTTTLSEENKVLTQKECINVMFKAYIESFKTGKSQEQSFKDNGYGLKEVFRTLTGVTDETQLEDFLKRYEETTGYIFEGKNAYLIKKAVFPESVLEKYVEVIDKSSTNEFEILLLYSSDSHEIGYKRFFPGIELYLIRGDSKEEAIQKTKDPEVPPNFHFVFQDLPRDSFEKTLEALKEYDSLYTEMVKDPSKKDQLLDKIGL